jgi:Mycotoxin biosynthesis protein UstYa
MIRQSVRPDYYKGVAPGMVNGHEEDLLFGPRHVAHCIESIRQALMCHVDVTPYTWVWNNETQIMKNVFATPHTCRNFDKIRDWASPERNGGRLEAGFDVKYREMNDPLDPETWVDGYNGN